MSLMKFIVQLVAAGLAAVVPIIAQGPLDTVGWFNVIALAAGAAYVFLTSNDIPGWEYAKTLVSVVAAVCVVLMSVWSDGVSPMEWLQVAAAGLGALGVLAVPNRPVYRPGI